MPATAPPEVRSWTTDDGQLVVLWDGKTHELRVPAGSDVKVASQSWLATCRVELENHAATSVATRSLGLDALKAVDECDRRPFLSDWIRRTFDEALVRLLDS